MFPSMGMRNNSLEISYKRTVNCISKWIFISLSAIALADTRVQKLKSEKKTYFKCKTQPRRVAGVVEIANGGMKRRQVSLVRKD